MSFLVDTDICSEYLRGNHRIWHRFMMHNGALHLSTVTLAELVTWVHLTLTPVQLRTELEDLIRGVQVLNIDESLSRLCGQIRADMLNRGISVALPDLMNAAIALTLNLTMVTHNIKDHQNVPGLTVPDWLGP